MAFEGYLIKFGNTVLPNEFLNVEGWDATPNQRLQKSANRDANMTLHMVTSRATKTKIVMTTKDDLHLSEKIQLQNIINSGITNQLQRKVRITYWNDETNDYVTSSTGFYMPDIKYKIKRIEGNDIIYRSLEITFVEI